jgi:hypothetical protein
MHKLLVVLALILTTMVVNSGEAAATRISTAAANTTCQGSWTKMPSRICTWCEKGLLGARRCHWIGCGNAGCNYIIVGGGGTRASRIVLNDCIKNYDRCRRGCTYYPWHPDSVLPPPPPQAVPLKHNNVRIGVTPIILFASTRQWTFQDGESRVPPPPTLARLESHAAFAADGTSPMCH